MMSARFGSGRAALFAAAAFAMMGSHAVLAQPSDHVPSSRKRMGIYDGHSRMHRLFHVSPTYQKRTPVTDADFAAVAAQAKRDRKNAKRLQVLARTQREGDGYVVTA